MNSVNFDGDSNYMMSYLVSRNDIDKFKVNSSMNSQIFRKFCNKQSQSIDFAVRHRKKYPAHITKNGVGWYNRGMKHNAWGPAVIFVNGELEYYLDGDEYNKDEWEKERMKDDG